MLVENLIVILIGAAASMIGALPFGLVNLTVLNVSQEQGYKPAMRIAHGASVIEVLFGLISILAGSLVYQQLEGNSTVSYIAASVLVAGGIFFFFKKQVPAEKQATTSSGFLKGAILNLVSIQVFLFWIVAIAFLSARGLIQYHPLSIVGFLSGIWLGKMGILYLYMKLGNRLLTRSTPISQNINRVIGFVLVGMAFIQFLKP